MGDALQVGLATTVAMVLVLVVAGAVLSFVAFPYRGRALPWRKHTGGQGQPGR